MLLQMDAGSALGSRSGTSDIFVVLFDLGGELERLVDQGREVLLWAVRRRRRDGWKESHTV
jgi:hypothetical protein